MSYLPGYYWVQQYKGEKQFTIARLSYNSGWEYMSTRHSSKMIRTGPHKVLYRILEPIMETVE